MSNVALADNVEVSRLEQLTNGSEDVQNPVWSPDGNEIAFCMDGNIYRISSTGSDEVALTSDSSLKDDFSWSPDGTRIIFNKYNSSADDYEIWVMDKDGLSEKQISNGVVNATGKINSCAWSADGTKIAYTRESSLIVMNSDGSDEKVITTSQNVSYLGNIAWSPDGNEIIFEENVDLYDTQNLNIINYDGTNLRLLANDKLSGILSQSQSWQSQVWSSDGSEIVYTSFDFHDESEEVYTVKSDGTGKNLVYSYSRLDKEALFSPDSNYIAYTDTGLEFSPAYVLLMDADGNNIVRLTEGSDPVWSPDGTEIAYISDGNLWLMSLGNSSQQNDDNQENITVDASGGGDFTTIQAAVDAASEGANILVYPGIYSENIDVNKQLNITSTEGASVTTVTATSSDDHVFDIMADGVTISGFTITGADYNGAIGTTTDTYIGAAGIHTYECDNVQLSDNVVTGNFNGIYLYHSEQCTLRNNVMNDNERNFGLYGYLAVANDVDTSNTVNGKPVYYLVGESGKTFDSSSDAGLIVLVDCDNIVVKDLAFSNNLYGIYLHNTTNSLIENIDVSSNRYGIALWYYSDDNDVINNTLYDNDFGVSVHGVSDRTLISGNTVTSTRSTAIQVYSNDNKITGNTVSGNYGHGISIDYSNNIVADNTASNNGYMGIYLSGNSVGSVVTDNLASGNGYDGIILNGADQTTVNSNTFTDNVRCGIQLRNSTNNLVYNNLFYNGDNLIFTGTNSGNTWNTTKSTGKNIVGGSYLGGNYWASPAGTGFSETGINDGDGFCNAVYEIDENNIDYLPLTTSEVPDIPHAPVLYNVTPVSGSTFSSDTSSVPVRFNYSGVDSEVNISSVIFTFDSVDVTENASITNHYARYNVTSPGSGTHYASVHLSDYAGNSVTFSTTFTISNAGSSSGSFSSSGGGGGGGGGSTGEMYANILVKDVESVYVYKDTHIVYEFSEQGNAITSIQFDGLKNSGSIQTIIEVLSTRSSFADTDAPGDVYQQMNIWVGKNGFASSENVENPLVTFKVEKSWFEENNVEKDDVNLYRFSKGAWNSLPTTITYEDDEYVHYQSETPGFSPFAISCEREEDISMSVDDKVAEVTVEDAQQAEIIPVSLKSNDLMVMSGLIGLILLGGIFLYRARD